VDGASVGRFEQLTELGRNVIQFLLGFVHFLVNLLEESALLCDLCIDVLRMVVQVLCNDCDLVELFILLTHERRALVFLKQRHFNY
jgi:hypothetical protein